MSIKNDFEKYQKMGEMIDEGTPSGDYKKINKGTDYGRKYTGTIKKKSREEQEEIISYFLENLQSPSALNGCALMMLQLDIEKEKAIKLLEENSKNEDIHGLIRFSASNILAFWEKGELRLK